MLSGLGESLELDPELLDDLRTAVSEACNNVVLHAYEGATGPLVVAVDLEPEGFEVRVRDHGTGIRRVSASEDRMGVGLAVISALADGAEFDSATGGGTEVRMSFPRRASGVATADPSDASAVAGRARRRRNFSSAPPVLDPLGLTGDIVATVAPAELLPNVLGRLLRAAAASARFTVVRFAALHELAVAIGEHAAAGGIPEVSFSIAGAPRCCELRVGPLPPGSAAELAAARRRSGELEELLGEVRAAPVPGGELLTIAIVERL